MPLHLFCFGGWPPVLSPPPLRAMMEALLPPTITTIMALGLASIIYYINWLECKCPHQA